MIKYISSSGRTFSFDGNGIRVLSGSFHETKFIPNITQALIGAKVNSIGLEPVTYSCTLIVSGAILQRKTILNALHEAFDHDVYRKTPGYLQIGKWKIQCFPIYTKTYPNVSNDKTLNDVQFYCHYPMWKREEKHLLRKNTFESKNDGLEFPFDFPFDFEGDATNIQVIDIKGYRDCDFNMFIHGPVNNPLISFDGYPYQVYTKLNSDEALEINSSDRTIVKILGNGIKENLFNSRRKDVSVFRKLDPGNHIVSLSSDFTVELTIYQERSEPEWS